jgi:hypothetical protein
VTLGDKLARAFGLALGLGLVVATILVAAPAGGHGGVLPASLRFAAAQDGAVAVSPAAPKPLLRATAMRPGSHASGELRLTNQTGEKLSVGLRAEPSSTALDGLAHVRIESGGKVLADTTLQALRAGSEGSVRLAPGESAKLRVRVSIPADTETGYEGASVQVTLVPVYGGDS